ncbi:uncharacterized protein LOC108595437 isoform X1 [Drosophila busckii]|uniref:uncharacterized protein LOC108595437 isoform X1 n=1 Tax=Drosophila busckii TaxID=30019 RepID=UPI00083EEF73|nr:uncharacterized protein LOC108595437 isoform X1 [Drosophila busckii]
MASIVGYTPKAGIEESVPVWLKIDWNDEVLHNIYRDWATYYSNRRRETFALHYYNKALELNGLDDDTLYRRSQAKRKAAQIEGALQDARAASKMAIERGRPNVAMSQQICDALFELNRMEMSKVEMHNQKRMYTGVKAKTFDMRLIVIEDVIKDATGKACAEFYLKNQKVAKIVNAIIRANELIDERPRWKILKEQGKCDVLSIPEEEEEILSPLEAARRQRAFNIAHQTFLNEAWLDVRFMKNLNKNPNLFLRQCKYSKDFLEMFSRKQYAIVRKFIKMIHSRSPLYLASYLKYANNDLRKKSRSAFLNRVQYQTHRNMNADLKKIKELRQKKDLRALQQYVENIMGEYYVIKTQRVMCWKFEFINEVYNTLALALTEQYYVPKHFKPTSKSMFLLLRLKEDTFKEVRPFVFGDRSTYQDVDVEDQASLKAKQLIARMERRILFADYSIEKCYLYHQIASEHFKQGRHDECCLNARRAMKECKNCNSWIWAFLACILIVKSNTTLYKVERTKEALELGYNIAQKLKNPVLIRFIEACIYLTDELFKKKASMQTDRQSKIPDRQSNRSFDRNQMHM